MLWNLATKWIGAIKTSIYIYVSPVITVILSVLILHEKITVISIIGTVLILIGLVISQKTKTTDQIRCIICDNKAKKEIGTMYYVPDGTKKCGYYECKKCGNRFLSLQTMEKIPCPDCEAEIDYEIGPDESMEDILDTAQLLQKIEGEEEVEKMDALLSLAITGGDCNWI